MSQRDAFLARVQQAAKQGRQYRVPVSAIPENAGYVGVHGDLCQHFAAEITAVGGLAFLVPDLASATAQLRELLALASAESVICWRHELLDRLGLGDVLTELNMAAVDYDWLAKLPEDERRKTLLVCDVGITSCDCAIAETGTLMMCARVGQERVASLVAPLHIAIVERRQIVPDLIDAFELLAKRGLDRLPSNVTFITGPSKTGDIELQLTTGVHGPGKWRVIVVEGE
jgi:L-lactate dehydrogenase complex protein LldG